MATSTSQTGKAAARPWATAALLAALPVSVLPQLVGLPAAWWPTTGLVAALLLLHDRRHAIPLAGLAAVVLAVTVAVVQGGLGPGPALGVLLVVLPGAVAARLLRPRISVASTRFHAVVLLASAGGAVLVAALVLLLEGPELAVQWLVTGFLATATALLVVLPLLERTPARRARAPLPERLAQRVLTVGVVLVVPWLGIATAVLFPLLAWAAMRTTRRETHGQLALAAIALHTMGLADLGALDPAASGLPYPLAVAPELLYLTALSLLVLPLARAVERLHVAQDRAEQNAGTLERMLAAAPNTLIVVVDTDLRITQYNTGAGDILGYDDREVEGRGLELFYDSVEVARLADQLGTPAVLARVIAAQVDSGQRVDHELRSQDGRRHTVSMSLSPVIGPDGALQGWLACGDDVTERIRTQRALEAALSREHESVRRLEEVDHVKQELVSNVSHELRTPITSIAGYAELLTDDSLGELSRAQRDAVQRIERNALRLRNLVDDLLTLSRAEAGRLQLQFTEVDLRTVVTNAWELFEEQLRRRDLETELVVPPAPVRVVGDQHALERVVVNLVGNAVKFTPDGGTVTLVLAAREAGTTRLIVSDSGIGIAEKEQERLFTRFFRASAATEAAIQGTGLGLSIVQSLVEQHGGQVSLRSRPGAGTRVTVELPTA